MRIATWNLQRKRPTSPNGKTAVDHLRSVSPDIAVLTEAWVDHLGSDFEHTDAGPSGIPHLREEERKVVIASRWPITKLPTPEESIAVNRSRAILCCPDVSSAPPD